MTKSILNKALTTTAIITAIALPTVANAGCFSDYCANKKAGEWNRDMTLKYGGTYSDAARAYNNYRYGYGTGNNYNFYDTVAPGTVRRTSGGVRQTTPEECDRILETINSVTTGGAKRIAMQAYNQTCN